MRAVLLAALVALPLSVAASRPAAAQDPDEIPVPERVPAATRTSRPAVSLSQDGPGLQFRAGHLAFPTFGRDESISHIELFPYILDDDQMFFGDFRLFLSNRARLGGNAGFGYRYQAWERVFGGSLWYDVDDTTGRVYQQLGLSLETYGDYWDGRSNLYLPIATLERTFGRDAVNERFEGHHILFDQVRTFGRAMRGIDYEVGFPLPTDFARRQNLRLYTGGYHFQGGRARDINGFRSRFEADLTAGIATQVELTRDRTFGTNVMVGGSIAWTGGFRRGGKERRERDRMGEFVQRNYNVIVSRQTVTTADVTAVNPVTGTPWVVNHVSPNGNSDGSFESPFATLDDALAAEGDFVLVHAGTVLTDPVVLQEGQRVFGDAPGAGHVISVDGIGDVVLPRAALGSRPVIHGVTGDAVTLASDTVFSGFLIRNPTGHGIVGHGISNAVVSHTRITGAGVSGVFLQDTAGDVSFTGMQVAGAAGAAFHVDGGAGNVRFVGSIENSAGRALIVENTTDGHVDLAGSTLLDVGGAGVRIFNADGDVTLDNVTVRNGVAGGIDVDGGDGNYTFLNATRVINRGGPSVNVENAEGTVVFERLVVNGAAGAAGVRIVDSPGDVAFGVLNVTTSGAEGLFVRNSGRIGTLDGVIETTGAAAVDLEGARMRFALTSVSSDGAAVGLRLVNAPGEFMVAGTTDAGTGGVIQNADTGVLLQNVGTVAFRFVDFEDNRLGIDAHGANHLVARWSRFNGSEGYAIDAMNVARLDVVDSIFHDNNRGGTSGTVRALADRSGNYTANFTANHFSAVKGDAVSIDTLPGAAGSSLILQVANNRFTSSAEGFRAVAADWNGNLRGTFTGNRVIANGADSRGFDLLAASPSAVARITMVENWLTFAGADATGVAVTAQGPSEILVGRSHFDLNGPDGTGMEFTLARSAQVDLRENLIVERGGGGTGILFTSVSGPSQIALNANTIQMRGPAGLLDRGIFFSSVSNENGSVALSGTQNNVIQAATVPFFVPHGTTTGTVRINGQLAPRP